MQLLSILLISTHFATLNAFPNIWGSEPKASTNLDSMTSGDTFVIIHPIDPSNSEQISRTEDSLGKICGSEHVKSQQAKDGHVSWVVTLSDRETINLLPEHPWLQLDETAKRTLVTHSKRHTKRSDLDRRDDAYYNIVAKDYNDDAQTKATREFLNTKLTDPNQKILEFNYPGTDHIIGWGHVQLSDAAKGEVEKYEGVTAPLGEEVTVEDDRVAINNEPKAAPVQQRKEPIGGMIRTAYNGVTKRVALLKRAVTWKKQVNAGWDLVMVSQPKEMKDDKLTDFVYDENAGKDTWIYIIDSGAAYKVKNKDDQTEFPNATPLQTQNSKDAGEKEDQDGSENSHGTMVASKALGQKYGIAKNANLISVKLISPKNPADRKASDFIQGLEAVANDLAGKTERHGKTVVISSLGFSNNVGDGNLMRPIFERLFEWGVPFISSSGNTGVFIPDINRLPKTLEGPDMPIINVGAVDNQRKKADYSQAGPHLTLYAPGGLPASKLTGQSRDDKTEREDKGTSFSAPIVAGVIATYFNYNPPPWDGTKTGKARVQAIKEFIVKDDSSWDDSGKERAIWNGAKKADHQSAQANGQSPPGPSGPTKAVSIIGAYIPGAPTFDWLFFLTDYGKKVECRTDALLPKKTVPWDSSGTTYPEGSFDLDLDGKKCQYVSGDKAPGKLVCGDKTTDCANDPADSLPDKGEYQCDNFKRQPVFTCPY